MLDALGQAGDGWYRQVALAVKMKAPEALGIDRREFVDTIGLRMGRSMVERDQAIRQLTEEGMSQTAIADILGVSPSTVRAVQRGEDPYRPHRPELPAGADENAPAGRDMEDENAPAGRAEEIVDLRARLTRAEAEAEEAENNALRRQTQLDRLRARHHEVSERLRALEEGPEETLDQETLDRLEREMREGNNRWLSEHDVRHTIGLLIEARETVAGLIEKGVTNEQVERLTEHVTQLVNEFEVARAAASLNG